MGWSTPSSHGVAAVKITTQPAIHQESAPPEILYATGIHGIHGIQIQPVSMYWFSREN